MADLGLRKMINDNKRSPNWKGRVGEVMPAKMLIGIERNAATQRYNGQYELIMCFKEQGSLK